MDHKTIKTLLEKAIKALIKNSSTPEKLKSLEEKHKGKLHFIPYRYRIFGGILQSMNIQFGNFLETIMAQIIKDNPQNKIITKYSGKKKNKFELSKDSDALIDAYISTRQDKKFSESELKKDYQNLITKIKANEKSHSKKTITLTHDVDILFQHTTTYYYVEIKYNDDHDTGKFVDINRKFLKTYAYLQRALGDVDLQLILFYFNNKTMKVNPYLPENGVVYRGQEFFDQFTKVKYKDLDKYMTSISESAATKKIFDDLYKKIVVTK